MLPPTCSPKTLFGGRLCFFSGFITSESATSLGLNTRSLSRKDTKEKGPTAAVIGQELFCVVYFCLLSKLRAVSANPSSKSAGYSKNTQAMNEQALGVNFFLLNHDTFLKSRPVCLVRIPKKINLYIIVRSEYERV